MATQIRSLSHRRRILGGSYAAKVLDLGPIAYWPLDEASGSVAACRVNSAQNGTYTGVTLANDATGPFGTPAPYFDGTNDYVNIYSATLSGAFDRDTGSLAQWIKVYNVGVWTDGSARTTLYLRDDASNYFSLSKPINSRFYWLRRAAATNQAMAKNGIAETDWIHVALTWDQTAEELKAYYNGVQEGATQSGLLAWTGGGLNNTQAAIGAGSTVPASVWHGYLAHPALWDRVLPAASIAALANP
jgi:hypothetical protein